MIELLAWLAAFPLLLALTIWTSAWDESLRCCWSPVARSGGRSRSSRGGDADSEPADDFLPVYDVSDAVATVADTDRETAWRALLDVDLLELGREAPVVGMLGALRMLPEVAGHLLHGERPAKPPESMRLRNLP